MRIAGGLALIFAGLWSLAMGASAIWMPPVGVTPAPPPVPAPAPPQTSEAAPPLGDFGSGLSLDAQLQEMDEAKRTEDTIRKAYRLPGNLEGSAGLGCLVGGMLLLWGRGRIWVVVFAINAVIADLMCALLLAHVAPFSAWPLLKIALCAFGAVIAWRLPATRASASAGPATKA